MKMEYTAEIIRGWPNDGALDTHEPVTATKTLYNGDWVAKESDGTVDISGASASNRVGLVIRGNGDSPSAVAAGNRAVVLWSNFIVKVSNYTAGAYAPGSNVTVESGKIALAEGGDPVLGFVKDVVAVGPNETAHLVIVVR